MPAPFTLLSTSTPPRPPAGIAGSAGSAVLAGWGRWATALALAFGIGLIVAGLSILPPSPAKAGEATGEAADEAGAKPESTAGEADAKRAVPAAEAIDAQVTRLREIFKKEYRAREPKARLALVEQLLATADTEGIEPAARYAALSEAVAVAADAKDYAIALDALDRLEAAFDADAIARRYELVAASAKALKRPDESDAAMLAEAFLQVTTRALRAGDPEVADDAAGDAYSYARKAKDKELFELAKDLRDEVRDFKRVARTVERTRGKLKASPEDPALNAEVGGFDAYWRGDWKAGLPLLAKGGDATAAALAKTELGQPTLPTVFFALANGWWKLGETFEERIPRENLYLHAAPFYAKALPELSGLDKAMAEKRLEQAEAIAARAGALVLPEGGATAGSGKREPGLLLTIYEGDAKRPVYVGVTRDDFVFGGKSDLRAFAEAKPEVTYRVVWEGYFQVPVEGAYNTQTYISAKDDTPARFHVEVDAMGGLVGKKHGGTMRELTLKEGIHTIRAEYVGPLKPAIGGFGFRASKGFQGNRPDQKHDWAGIPPEALFHDPVAARRAGYRP